MGMNSKKDKADSRKMLPKFFIKDNLSQYFYSQN